VPNESSNVELGFVVEKNENAKSSDDANFETSQNKQQLLDFKKTNKNNKKGNKKKRRKRKKKKKTLTRPMPMKWKKM